MRSGDIPFKFDLTDLVTRARRQISGRVGNITLSLPFISIEVSPKDRERQIAREIVLRLRDRRVLSAWECCDNCIDKALASLREIRQLIVDKEVELADLQDGPLFLLLDTMAAGIRQFMTFEELLRRDESAAPILDSASSIAPPTSAKLISTRSKYCADISVAVWVKSRALPACPCPMTGSSRIITDLGSLTLMPRQRPFLRGSRHHPMASPTTLPNNSRT